MSTILQSGEFNVHSIWQKLLTQADHYIIMLVYKLLVPLAVKVVGCQVSILLLLSMGCHTSSFLPSVGGGVGIRAGGVQNQRFSCTPWHQSHTIRYLAILRF